MSSDIEEVLGAKLAQEVYKELPAKVERALFPSHVPYHGAVYQPTPFTRYQFLESMRVDAELRTAVANLYKRVTAAAVTVACELFARVYAPRTGRVTPPNPLFGWAAQWFASMEQTTALKRYQRMYQNDVQGATVACVHLLNALLETLPEDTPRQAFDPNAENIESAVDEFAVDEDSEDPDAVLQRAKDAAAVFQQHQQQQQQDAAASNWDLMGRIARRPWGRLTHNALESASAEQAEFRDLFAGLGLPTEHDGSAQRKPPAVKAALAQRLRNNPRLRRIALLAGRFRLIAADKQRGARGNGYLEVGDVEHGRNIARLMPKELLGLVDLDFADAFDRGYAEGRLWQYQLQATPPQGRGPIVFCIDVSGSMDGDRDVWAKALFAGVSELAMRQRRWCYAIQFDNRVQREDRFDPRKPNPVKFMECVSFFSGGGTRFDPPVTRALDVIASDKEFKKADVVFLTDGDAEIHDDTVVRLRQVQERTPVTFHGILVGGDACGSTLRPFCDNVTLLPDVLSAAVDVANKLYSNLVAE